MNIKKQAPKFCGACFITNYLRRFLAGLRLAARRFAGLRLAGLFFAFFFAIVFLSFLFLYVMRLSHIFLLSNEIIGQQTSISLYHYIF